MGRGSLRNTLLLALAVIGFGAAGAGATVSADSVVWFPHDKDATWTWEWTDSVYNTTPTAEKVTVKEVKGQSFILAWSTKDQGNAAESPSSEGLMAFQQTSSGLVNTDWQSTPPPASFPILCASATQCGNSVASVLYQLIWGSRSPVLAEPLITGVTWASTGGANNDVTSASTYLGQESVTVPAFESPVTASKVRADITQAGAIGDPYGSGVRTVWWVAGVGPVKIVFEHAGGSDAPISTAVLKSTNQKPAASAPVDANYFPLKQGKKARYSWSNTKWLKKPSVQLFTVSQTANQSARVDVKHVSGPIRVAGSYGFALRTDGLTNIWGATKAASLAKFPKLGPGFLPADKRRHFFTPYDLMIYGTNPILEANPVPGQSWTVKDPSRDFSVFGATGTTTVVGLREVKVPAGKFLALVVQSKLKQVGFPFGSGTRTSYFAPNKGLVKLVFRHDDSSVSTVELLK
jgi:hypothetical protein